MASVQGFDFFELHFDSRGALQQRQELQDFTQHIENTGVTDAIFIAHGFRNDENDASGLYSRFLETFRAHLLEPEFDSLASRKFAVAGVYWPSKPFSEGAPVDGSVQGVDDEVSEKAAALAQLRELQDTESDPGKRERLERAIGLLDQVKNNSDAQDEFVSLVLSLLDGSVSDPAEGLDEIRAKSGSELLDKLKFPIILPTVESSEDEGGATSVNPPVVADEDGGAQGLGSFFGSIFGNIGKFLNLSLWYVMKERSGTVGEKGVADAVREVHGLKVPPKIHLVGHSLGGRLMAACAKRLASDPEVHPDSLTLLEAAFSHYGFSTANGNRPNGFFRTVVDSKVVRGPLIATYSAKDTVVGHAYAITSRLAGDNIKAIGDANDPFGGIGRNGAQQCDVAVSEALHTAGTPYTLPSEKIICLNGSAGLITDHGDVTNT
ncbi:MAG: hypothetical protein H7Y20_13460, partial [Bryobacteraceae bacterium]|nr:hypothetical protein [Bryobacteraceae bacterium]